MEYYKDDWSNPLTPEKKLKAIIVGAGIAGLVTGIALKRSGHEVIILEQVKEIAEVGAGIQMAPNNLRILGRLGVLPEVLLSANLMKKNSLRRWKDNEELGTAPLMPQMAERYGASIVVIHRGDLQRIILEAAKKELYDIRTNHKVTKVDGNFEARVQLQSGQWLGGDLVVAADGIKSNIRRHIAEHHKHEDHAAPTDGPEQQERDRKIKEAAAGKADKSDLWADKTFQQFIWGTDIMSDTLVKWPEGTHLHALSAIAY
ncbi:hypothetical protein R6Q59_010172 [Mikania micrantha]